MGYHKIRMESEYIPMTTFNTKYGNVEFVVLPFGLTSTTAIFMELINKVFAAKLDTFVIVYLEDILINSILFEEHFQDMKAVVKKMGHDKL